MRHKATTAPAPSATVAGTGAVKSDFDLGIPGEDEDILLHLVDKRLITPDMQEKIHAMRGFRNIVVHRYGAIDDALAFRLLTENIGDFSLFTAEIEKILEPLRHQ